MDLFTNFVPTQRTKLKVTRGSIEAEEHGTVTGFLKHMRRKEPACAQCYKAQRKAEHNHKRGR